MKINYYQSIQTTFLWQLIAFMVLLSPSAFAYISAQVPYYALSPELEYFQEPEVNGTENPYSINQAMAYSQWNKSEREIPNFGFQTSAYWFKLSLDYIDYEPKDWILEVRSPLLDQLEYFLVIDGQVVESQITGDSFVFFERPILHRNFLFNVPIQANQSIDIYFRVSSRQGAILFPVYLWQEQEFYLNELNSLLFYGIYYGLMLAFVLYNLFIYFSTRDLSYFFYVCCMISGVVVSANLQGLDYQYLWPDAVNWQQKSSTTISGLVIASGMLFTIFFLNLKTVSKKSYYFMLVISVIAILDSLNSLFFQNYPLFTTVLGIVGASSAMSFGILSQLRGNRSARFYNYAWLGLLIGGASLGFAHLGLLPFNYFTEHGVMIGFSAQGLFFSFALADRINQLTEQQSALREQAELSQTNLEQIITSLPNFLIIIDQSFTIKKVNEFLLKKLGYQARYIINQPLSTLIAHKTGGFNIEELLENSIEAPVEIEFISQDNQPLSVLFSNAALNQGYVCSAQDLTELKQIEKDRNLAQGQLIQAQKVRTIGTLAGGIAHDMNNILTPVVGCTDIVLHNLHDDDPNRKLLEKVMSAAERAKDLVRQILNFSRPSTEEQKPLNLSSVVTDALELVRAAIPNTIQIHLIAQDKYPLVTANYGQLHQIILNLCTNASHAMPDRLGHIHVNLSHQIFSTTHSLNQISIPEGEYVCLTIQDDGSGMTQETQARIFDPFFTTKEQGEGTGLGLAIVQSIIAHHGGYIDLESEVGQGSAFHIYFPVNHEDNEQSQVIKKTSIEQGKEHILFVDDEEAIAFMMQHMLEQLGYKITTFTNSQLALDSFKQEPDAFDLVISDQTMPVLSGTQMLSLMLEQKPQLKGIILTGSGGSQAKEFCQRSQLRFLMLNKPISLPELSAAMRELLDQ